VAETPRRDDEGEASIASRLAGPFQRFRQFLREVRAELKQVNWPTFTTVRSTTVVVIVTVFVFGLFLFVVDYGVSWVVEQVLTRFRQ
jgi:preprotein translocase subunit SecE